MANTIAEVVKYYPQFVDEKFEFDSVTDELENTSLSAKAIKLDTRTYKFPKIATSERSGYNRLGHGGTNDDGEVSWEYETHTLDFERMVVLPIDHLDNEQAGAEALSQAIRHNTTHVAIPETDTYRLSKLASYTNEVFGNRVVETITTANAKASLDAFMAWLRKNGIANANALVFASPDFVAALAGDETLTKILRVEDTKGEVGYEIWNYLGLKIKVAPSDRLYTDCNLVANPKDKGCHPTSTSKVINFLGVEKEAVACKRVLDYARVFDSVTGGAYIGNFVGYRFISLEVGCCFVPDNKVAGVYANISSANALGAVSIARIAAVKGSAEGKTLITNVVAPNGMLYDSIYENSSAYTLGAAASGTQVSIGVEFTPTDSTNNKSYFALVRNGYVVAVSGQLTMPVAEYV